LVFFDSETDLRRLEDFLPMYLLYTVFHLLYTVFYQNGYHNLSMNNLSFYKLQAYQLGHRLN
jgi:hypothetical protein